MKLDEIRFLTVDDVKAIHRRMIDKWGGLDGLRSETLLESAVFAPQASFGGVLFFDTLAKMAASYAFSVAKNHAFADGNKRTGLAAAAMFLGNHGYHLQLGKEWKKRMEDVVEGTVAREKLARWFAEEIGGDVKVTESGSPG